jgi:hypothetical protein
MQIELLQQRVSRNPFDNESWELLIEELVLVRKQPQGEARLKETLQSCVRQYPTAVRLFLKISFRCPHCMGNLSLKPYIILHSVTRNDSHCHIDCHGHAAGLLPDDTTPKIDGTCILNARAYAQPKHQSDQGHNSQSKLSTTAPAVAAVPPAVAYTLLNVDVDINTSPYPHHEH